MPAKENNAKTKKKLKIKFACPNEANSIIVLNFKN